MGSNQGTMETVVGVYQHEKSEGLDEYLTKLGVPWIAKKFITASSPIVKISKEGDVWTINFKVAIKNNTIVFKIGEEFTENSPVNNSPQKSVATMEDGNLVICSETQKGRIKRTFMFNEEGFTLEMFSVSHGVSAKRIFKRKV